MTRKRHRALVLFSALALLPAAVPATATPDESSVLYEVHAPLGSEQALFEQGFDVMEHRDGDSLFVLGDAGTRTALERAGFKATVDQVLPEPPQAAQAAADTFYGGYHTVNAHYQHLDQVAREHPDLATVVDYGDSWLKTQNRGGHDLRAICITAKRPGDCALSPDAPKPRFFVMGQLHARELTTGETAWRWIDHLVQGHGTDPEVTALLESTEFWVVPVANPDGVDYVEVGGDAPHSHRKNGRDEGSRCEARSDSHYGVDLNRNTSSNWESAQNISYYECRQTYRGTAPDSEPETQALQGLWRSLYPDRRAPERTQAAPTDTAGMVLSLHSYGNLVLFPWTGGVIEQRAGNDAALRQHAQELAEMAGADWQYGQSGQVLYSASGTTDDWVYDDLGVASYVWEMGGQPDQECGGFFPAYSCQETFFWPKALPMLLHSAHKAAAPYAPVPEPSTECVTRVDTDTPLPGGTVVTLPVEVSGCEDNARSTSRVDVTLKNLSISYLRMDLIAPDSTTYRLETQRQSTGTDDSASYTVDLSRETREGTWQLRVNSLIWLAKGDVDSWSLTL
ncbi:M14 family zinc carboxypeptidase [Saccharothrix coeruleofusca]|uniref:Zinc carboxypeptidase n=1 Tax=Saccharothrix coeruleofusca TaxID=33919 RepID=A0A918EEC8_9PSEU|nr:M14 family zinc carboxypeptidase [Saccharothrix coeruleofusca]GGP55278.1 hypothetical protein GCM10010185_29800 [Saccharothrix coeruleofusca]